jgi:glyoxylase-like metal-dependent hydrolase (beta-lactamase superfamily II)
MRLRSIDGNRQRLDGGAMYGNCPRAVWEKWSPPDEQHRIPLGCRALLVEDGQRRVLFETGIGAFFEPKLRDRYGVVEPEHVLLHSLERAGVAHDAIDVVVLSHLHFDHAGGAELLPNARLVVQRREWEAGADDDLAARCSFDAKDYRHGHDLQLVDGEHDLFGDGRVVCLPTHGHTPGHQSLRLRLDDGREVVLCADACYLKRNLDELALPGVVFDRERMMESLQRLAALRSAGCTMVYGHDPEAWSLVPQSPAVFGEGAGNGAP